MEIVPPSLCIAISGKSGCGNTSISTLLSNKLAIQSINYTFRSLAKEKKKSLEEICKLAENNPSFDKLVDKKQQQLSKKTSCIVASRLAIWLIHHANIKIYLYADLQTRSTRIHKRERGNLTIRLQETKQRDLKDAKRYKSLYNIDINKYSKAADIIIDTRNKNKKTIIQEIVQALKKHNLIK